MQSLLNSGSAVTEKGEGNRGEGLPDSRHGFMNKIILFVIVLSH